MNLYVFRAKTLLINALAIVCIGVLVLGNYQNSQSVFRSESNNSLPIYCVDSSEKVCALTFDAAWGAEDTDLLIDILSRYKAKATFFVVGDWVDKYPDAVKKLSDAGHDVMNHSDTHKYMTKLTNEELILEVENCTKKIESITNKKVRLFRAPYGDYNGKVIDKLKELGYYTIQWDVDSLDWKDLSAEEIITRVTEKTKNGSIILFHNAAKNTPEALPSVIEQLKSKGYKFKKVNDLIYKKNYYIDNTGKQIKTK